MVKNFVWIQLSSEQTHDYFNVEDLVDENYFSNHNTVKIKNLFGEREIKYIDMLEKYYEKGFKPLTEIAKSKRAK